MARALNKWEELSKEFRRLANKDPKGGEIYRLVLMLHELEPDWVGNAIDEILQAKVAAKKGGE